MAKAFKATVVSCSCRAYIYARVEKFSAYIAYIYAHRVKRVKYMETWISHLSNAFAYEYLENLMI